MRAVSNHAVFMNQLGADRSLVRENPTLPALGPVLEELVASIESLMEAQSFWNMLTTNPKAWRTFLTSTDSFSTFVALYVQAHDSTKALVELLPEALKDAVDDTFVTRRNYLAVCLSERVV
jgi:hypothetical protein